MKTGVYYVSAVVKTIRPRENVFVLIGSIVPMVFVGGIEHYLIVKRTKLVRQDYLVLINLQVLNLALLIKRAGNVKHYVVDFIGLNKHC